MHYCHSWILILFVLVISTADTSAQHEMQQGLLHYKQGNYKDALAEFEKLISSGKATIDAYSAALDCAIKLKLNDKAVEIINKADKRFGFNYDRTLILAQLYAQGGKYNSAIPLLTGLRKSHPDSVKVKSLLADIYTSQGANQFDGKKYEEALLSFKEAYRLDPQNKVFKRNYLVAALKLNRYNEALPLAKDLYSPVDKDTEMGSLYFQLLVQTNNYKEALKVAKALAKLKPGDINLLLQEALAYRYVSEYDTATAIYQKLRQRFPTSRVVYWAEINWLMASGLRDSVISRCREFLVFTPDDSLILSTMAKQFQLNKSYDTARTIYREIISKDINRDAAIAIADCYSLEGKTDSAIIELQQYIMSGGTNSDADIKLYGLLLSAERFDELKKFLVIAIERKPYESIFRVFLAKQYFYEDKMDSTLALLERVRSLYAQMPEISFLYARVFESMADISKALFHYIRFVRSSMSQSQVLQTQISTTISGEGLLNPDSLDKAERTGSQLDSLNVMLKKSFDKIRELAGDNEYPAILDELILDVPQGTPLYIARAKYRKSIGNFSEAQADIETALRISQYNEEAQKEAGDFYYDLEKFDLAFNAYRAALSKNNKVKYYYDRLIDLGLRLSRENELIELWMRRYEADPEDQILKEALLEILHKTNRFEDVKNLFENE